MEVLDKEDIDNLKDLMLQKFVVDNLIESTDTKYQDIELLSEAEVNQLLQTVTSSEIDGNETIPTMAQSMGIKFSKTPTYSEVLDKVNAPLGIKQPKRGKLSKLRQGFDAAKVRHSDEFEALLNEKFEVPNELLSKKGIDNLLESTDTKYQDRELLSEAEVNQLLQSVTSSEIDENGTIPTTGIKPEATQADREM